MNCYREKWNQKIYKIPYQPIMKLTLFFCLCISAVLIGCDRQAEQNVDEVPVVLQESIKSKLESIALTFLRSWEPPYDPDAALALFTQREDFHLVISGDYTADNYLEWTEAVPRSMAHEVEFYNSYKHEVKYIETVVLSPQSGVVTIIYIWDSISKEGVHERTPGAITLTCRKENEAWKIVHYHGSHGEPEVIN
jgi:hypothetical protein